MNKIARFEVNNESELKGPVDRLRTLLQPGSWISLEGDLGAGKTTFVRNFLLANGYEDVVVSPTFPLLLEYEVAGQKFIHIDGFRLDGKSSDPWDWKEWKNSIVFVEWAERTQLPFSNFKFKIAFRREGESKRLITFFSV